MNSNHFPKFSAEWSVWKSLAECEIFDAIDDWLINGQCERVACRQATARMSRAVELFELADCLLAVAETMDQ